MKFYIRTFGCQMNAADSAYLAGHLAAAGYRKTERPEEAQVIIFNTCSVRGHAEERLFQNLDALRPLKAKKPELIIGLVGCVPVLRRDKLFRSFSHLNFLAGPESLAEVPDLISRSRKGAQITVFDSGTSSYSCCQAQRNISAFLPIVTGCDNFCSYCVVPFTRGGEKSRPADAVVKEAESMAAGGVKEITLLGQNVNSYRDENKNETFPELLARVSGIDGLLRLGFLTSHPKDVSRDLFQTIAGHANIYRHLHLPLQSGSDAVLKAMNRGYTASRYLEMVRAAREVVPGLALTSDVIVGFPDETEEDFKNTLSVVEEAEFDDLFTFKYSDRPGTAAEKLGGKIPEEVKEERLAQLWKLQDEISLNKNRAMKGRTSEVLFLAESRKKPGFLVGKTENEKKVLVAGNLKLVGCAAPVKIVLADRHLLYGQITKTV